MSASLLVQYARLNASQASARNKLQAEQRLGDPLRSLHQARSYALLNKVFFWLSIVSALAVLLWPSIAVIFKDKLGNREWAKSGRGADHGHRHRRPRLRLLQPVQGQGNLRREP